MTDLTIHLTGSNLQQKGEIVIWCNELIHGEILNIPNNNFEYGDKVKWQHDTMLSIYLNVTMVKYFNAFFVQFKNGDMMKLF